jgi:hypothetical protein
MRHRLILAASACALIVAALPAAAQDYNNPQQPAQQYKYPIGRAANDAGPNYSGTTENTPTEQRGPAFNERRGDNYYNYAGAPGIGAPQGDAVAYCESRFRSFDPATGTYMGFDGMRHACP